MGFLSFTQEIAVDLGTANTIIIHNNKIVIDEPSVVALDNKTGKLFAVGEKAREMYGKEHEGIRTVRPLSDGVIGDFNAAELMLRGMIKKVSAKNHWFSPSLRMVVCIPSGSTEVEIRAVRDSSEHAGGRDVYMIYEPMAAALGIGLDVLAPEGNMIVDIGGGTTEIAVISLGGIVSNKSIRVAGDDLTADIQEHMGRAHNVRVGERTAFHVEAELVVFCRVGGHDFCEHVLGPRLAFAVHEHCELSGGVPLHREVDQQNRGCRAQRAGEHSARALCRHCEEWRVPHRRRRAAARP